MPRKSTSKAAPDEGVIERMEFSMGTPPTPAEPRPGSAVSLEMVNVFGEPVAEDAGSAKGTPGGARLRLTAWVNNVAYVKQVWVDAYLTDAGGAVSTSETLALDYHQGAGGGGDFFVLDAPIPSKGPAKPAAGLQYRLYYQIGDTTYTEGILHEHALAPTARAAPKRASKPADTGPATGRSPRAKAPAEAKENAKNTAPVRAANAKRKTRGRPSA
jgi:hypothetical protein